MARRCDTNIKPNSLSVLMRKTTYSKSNEYTKKVNMLKISKGFDKPFGLCETILLYQKLAAIWNH